MNPNTPRPGHLFLAPRTPWGTRAGQQTPSQRQHTDVGGKHPLWGKEQQGLGGQMATEKSEWRNGAERTLDGQGVPRSLSGQLPPPGQPPGGRWQVPHTDLQPYHPQPAPRPPSAIHPMITPPATRAMAEEMRRQRGRPYRIVPKEKGPAGRLLEGLDGDTSHEGRHPGTEEPPDRHWWRRLPTNPEAREDLPNFDAPERHEGDEAQWRFLHPDKNLEAQKLQAVRPKKAAPGSPR
ncbi:hypothetical protein [Prosthecobacter vanneervenii]|uniref:Uncharacterized protein n=1 Tax=Prosthecobacter vanneervenii TaxID=48466 RepID=A0A7W8DMP0_9BACT|nr:hypothetical protein [Prosthecobacter vanneervenii]MBB5035553.1 hypothetical protein [Prosthecobacter vanneervenii]